MKFRINKDTFIAGLQQVQHVVGTKTTLPILSNVLLEAEGSEIKLTTTDLDVGVSGIVNAEITEGGKSTLPVRRLFEIARQLPDDEVNVEIDEGDHTAQIRSGRSYFKILGLGPDEFPPPQELSSAKQYSLPQRVLRDGLRKTSYAISTDETRYVLNGIFISIKEGTLIMVATDGRRLAMAEHELGEGAEDAEVIIPTKAIAELQRLLGDEGEVKIAISDNQISFELNKNRLTSRLIEGNYPNFRQVIPNETKERIVLDRETFLETVRRISILASDKSNSVKLVFGADSIEVAANAQDIGEATESLTVDYKGAEFPIAFNPEFLMAPLRNLDTPEVYLDLIDGMSPGVIKNDSSFLYVIMPMRVTG